VRRARLVIGLIGLGLSGGLNLNVVPLMTGAFVDELGLDASQVGTVLTIQVTLAAIVGIVLSTRMHLVAARAVGFAANTAVVAAALGYATVTSVPMLFAVSVLMGCSLGVLGVCSAATIATAERVDRTAAVVAVGISVLVAMLTVAIAHAVGVGGRRALFAVDAACVGASMALMFALPKRLAPRSADARLPMLGTLLAPIVWVSVFLNIGSNGVWTFGERIGVSLGLNSELVGDVLAGSTVLAMLGGAAAAVVARPRRERQWAMVGVVAFGLTSAAIAFAPGSAFYVVATGVQAFFFVFGIPFLTAVAIEIDASGGLAAAAGGWSTLIGAGVPMLAGFMIEHGGFASLGWLAVVSTLCAAWALYAVDLRPRGGESILTRAR
jgi:hypothetical protein